jgi:TonB family protein
MKRIVLVIVVALVGCQSNQPAKQADAGKRQAGKPPRVEAGGRFFARSTAGDAHDLKLHKLEVNVSTRPGTVRSQLTMEVATPADGQSEAVIRLPVPRGAAVTDAVLWVNDKPMRGAFVERQRARDIYTSIVTRRRDPALVTWDGPGWIAVSIFPLEKNRPRRFELEWVEPAAVADGRIQYRVPIVAEGDRVVGRASMSVDGRKLRSGGQDLVAIAPADRHAVFTRRAPGDPFQQVMVREPAATGAPRFVLVLETSAAMMGADRRRQRAMLDALLDELPADARVTMLATDWDVSLIVEDAGASAWPDALAKIDAVPSAGALHLERALREAGARVRQTGASAVLFLGIGGDGFSGDGVSGPLAELRDAHVRLSVVDVRAAGMPRHLADAAVETGGEAVAAPAFDEALPLLVDALRPRPSHPALESRGGGEWHVLRTVTGGAVWIGRALGADATATADTTRVEAGSPLAIDLASLWHRAHLEWHDRDATDEVPKVLTPVTSLLVLESDQDYQRFGLAIPEPVAVAQAEGVGRRGEQGHMDRREPSLGRDSDPSQQALDRFARFIAEPPQKGGPGAASIMGRDSGAALGADGQDVLGGLIGNQVGSAYGVGGLGFVGTGVGGGGTAEGTLGLGTLGTIGKGGGGAGNGAGHGRGAGGLGGRRARAPDVILGQANVRGSLDKEIIRRIIRRHLNEVKYCYEQELVRFPGLRGRVMVQFTIAASGQVIAAVLQNSTISNARIENCVVAAVRRWEFPHPIGGGIVIVSYPFTLMPDGGEPDTAARNMSAPPVPATPVRPIDEALATLAKGADAARIERISSLLGLRRLSSAEVLAWTIDRRAAVLETRLLVARLLELAKRHHDAVRVLTESAATHPDAIAAELRSMGADADATEVLRLAKR